MKKPSIAPSLMCMDLSKLSEQVSFFDDKVSYYHVDIMDGHFVPNLTLSPYFVEQLSKISEAPSDCHLMVTNPGMYIEPLAKAGAGMVSFHAETANGQAFRLIDSIRSYGMRCGLVLNPETRLEEVALYLARVDKVTLMTVDPGFAGQPFIPEMLDKIRAFKQYREQHGLSYEIEIDGSCNDKTFGALIEAGADILIVGTSGLFNNHSDIEVAWSIMDKQIESHMLELAHE